MAAGGGLPAFPPGHPLAHPNGSPHLTPSSLSGLTGPGGARPTSTPTTPSNAFAGRSHSKMINSNSKPIFSLRSILFQVV